MLRVITAMLLSGLCLAGGSAAAQVSLNDWLEREPDAQSPQATSDGGTTAAAAAPAPGGDSATRLQASAREIEQAVGLVVMVLPRKAGGFQTVPLGTAWAFAPSRLATNTHVVLDVAEAVEAGYETYVLRNTGRGESYAIRRVIGHPRFAEKRPNAFGQLPVGVPYDVGIIEIEGAFPATARLADQATLHGVASGTPVGFIGFPTEQLSGSNVNLANPIATMQAGIVTSVTDYYLEDRGPDENRLIRHNLPATGGASGSPIFTADGLVIGTLNGGNVHMVEFTTTTGTRQFRVPSAAQINFAQRIDSLADIRDR